MDLDTTLTFAKRDEYGRRVIAQSLITLLQSEIDISPVVLDGAWGSGKSEFCQKFINLAISEKANFRCIYIDAFKYDHCNDPLLMLITEISKLLKVNPEEKAKFIKNSLPLLKVLSKTALKAGVSFGLKMNTDKLSEEIKKAIEEGSKDIIDVGVEATLKDYEEVEDKINVFKETLKSIAIEKNVVIIIDELDRCRPSFALETLEKVKHVFAIESVKFIFSTNLKQLSAMVKKQYGHEIDAEFYLAKFFNYSVKLPNESLNGGYQSQRNAIEHFFKYVSGDKKFSNIQQNGKLSEMLIDHLFQKDNLSLRDAERLYRNIKIIDTFKAGSFSLDKLNSYSAMLFLGVYIYTFHSDIADKTLQEKLSEKDICKLFDLKFEDLKELESSNGALWYFAIMLLEYKKSSFEEALNTELKDTWIKRTSGMFPFGSGIVLGARLNILKDAMRSLQLKPYR